MTHQLPPLTKDLLDAFTASAVAWLLRLMGAVLHPRAPRRRRRLAVFVRRLERFVEHILFLKAVQGFGPLPLKSRTPRAAPLGFRRVRRRLTLFWKIARVRAPRGASLADRLARLIAAIVNPGRHVARFLKEIRRGLRLSRLVACAPPAHALAAAFAAPVVYADSS